MSDPIERQAAIDAADKIIARDESGNNDVVKALRAWKAYIKALPPAQQEIVKCKKCRYVYYDKEFGNYWCDRMSDSFKVEADGYCKWGK